MEQDVQRAAIELYDRFTHEGMDRRDFMAKLTRIAGSAAAASALLADVACKAETQPQIAANDSRLHAEEIRWEPRTDRKSTRLNSSHSQISYAVFCLNK